MTLAPDPRASRPHGGGVHDQASSSSSLHHSSSTTSAPAASPAAPTAAPPVCQNCATSTTPLWRRDESGQVLCNACGLFLKLHGRPRPISLKTDVIKSRNRIKNPHHAASHGHGHGHGQIVPQLGQQQRHPSAQQFYDARSPAMPQMQKPPHLSSQAQGAQQAIPSPVLLPLPHTSTPHAAHSSTPLGDPATPPGSTTHTTMESLVTANQTLRTRVSELELVNDLFRSRISELESNEASARKSELTRRELETQLQRKLEESGQKNLELQSRVEELEMEKERHATEREMKFREHQLMQQQQLLHPHLHHQLPKLPLPQTPASPALESNPEDPESQHMRKKMRVSDLVGGSNETGASSATPPQPPQSASRTGTPLQQILSPQVSHHQSHTQHLIPPLQLSPSNGNSNGGYNINGVNGINRISLPSVSSITLPPITAPGDGNGSAR
ncbi:hypothetical protein V1522DRAFT_350339 [Lipomyces starkeyi]